MKKFFSEFRTFALKGNVMDLAVGVIIGAAFQGVVTSLTENILSPIIALFAGPNFDALSQLSAGGILYGAFLVTIINFLIMAFVVFLLVKGINMLREKPKQIPPAPPARLCPYCRQQVADDATRCPHCTSNLQDKE